MISDLTAFKAALAKGSGRAMVLMRGDDEAFIEALHGACAVDLAYDPQCESPRAPYLARLVEASGRLEAIYLKLLEDVETWGGEEEVGLWHPLSVLTELVLINPALDRDRLKALVRAKRAEDEPLDFADLLVRLEGYPALIQALDLLAPRFEDDGWMASGWLADLRARDGEAIEAVLETDRRTNPLLDRALLAEQADSSSTSPPDPAMPLEDLRTALSQGELGRKTWMRRSDAELGILCADLTEIDDDERALPYLRLFSRQPFPGDPAVLERWIDSSVLKVRRAARVAIEKVQHPEVRRLALDRLASGEPWALGALARNFNAGDLPLVESTLARALDLHEAHGAALDVMDILDRNQVVAEDHHRVLEALYELTPCSFCRESVVRRLAEAAELPRWMAEECRFDANPDTVALVSA